MDLLNFRALQEPAKTIKFVVLSFKNEDRQNNIKNRIRRSVGSIFHEFAMVLGALAVILDALGSSVLEVHVERIWKRSQS